MAFVNKDDGVACLSHELLKQVLDDNHEEVEWVSVRSRLRSQYSISGKDGKLDKKISRTDFPRSVGLYAASPSTPWSPRNTLLKTKAYGSDSSANNDQIRLKDDEKNWTRFIIFL